MLPAKFVPLFLAAALSYSHADTEFQGGVPIELVKVFLGNSPTGDIRVFSDILDDFPSFQIPAGFTTFGSIDRGYSLSVVLTTDLPEADALNAISEAFLSTGYTEFEVPGARDLGTGFVRPNQTQYRPGSRICHDDLGFLSYSYAAKSDLNLVVISSNLPNDRRSCAQQFEEQAIAMSRNNDRLTGVRQYIPIMELPEDTSRRMTPFFGMGSSGSGNDIESRASLNSDWDIEEVFIYFKDQIEAQEWSLDSENLGTSTATGSWIRTPEPGVDLIGTLSVIKAGAETFELKFRIVSTGQTNSGGVFLQR